MWSGSKRSGAISSLIAPLSFSAQPRQVLRVPLFLDPGSLAAQRAEVVELRATDPAAAHHLDVRDRRAVDREDALDTNARADLPDGEVLADPTTPLRDHDALERLEALLVSLTHAHHDADRVAGTEAGNVRPQTFAAELNHVLHGRILVWCSTAEGEHERGMR